MSKSRKKSPRKSQVLKARARQAEKAGKELGKQTLLEAVQLQINEHNSDVDGKLKTLAQELLRVGQVQQHVAKANDQVASQFSVLTRLTISKLNEVIGLQNRIVELATESWEPKPDIALLEEVTYEGVNFLFQMHDAFRSRPDFRDHLETWFLGGDLTKLPPLPEPDTKEEEKTEPTPETPAEAGIPEGAQVFGGDHGSTHGNEESEADTERTATEGDSVHVMQRVDDDPNQAGDPAANAVVP